MALISNQKWGKVDWCCILGLAGLVFLFHWKVLGLEVGFYSGDHRQQHYPWAFFYAQQLKHGMLPWWTSLFGCGFPLLAEGQVGALYSLNFLFYKFFPFDFAYTYNILFHYVLGGGFFYLLVRSRGLSGFASFLGCLIYLFGTAQGGYYYNIISLKTLIWFPLALYFVFRIFEDRKYSFLFWLGLIFSFQLCAGYLQYAVYSIVFTGVTCLWLAIKDFRAGYPKQSFYGLVTAVFALVLGFLCAAPQLGATWELSQFSNRFDFPVEFAFVGSVNPLAIATLFFPHWSGFLRAQLYFGAIGLLFFLHVFRRSELMCKNYFIFGFILAVALALGGFNPIYRWIVEWFEFSSLRIPSKFLYFAGFYGAVLCAYGAETWFKNDAVDRFKTWRIWGVFSLLAGLGLVASHYFLQFFRKPLLNYFSDYIQKNYADSVIRPHSMEVYQQKLIGFYDAAISVTALFHIQNFIFLFFMLITGCGIFLSIRRRWQVNKAFVFFALLLFFNLWFFGNVSVRGNYEPKHFLVSPSKITDYLAGQDGHARLHRVFRDIQGADRLPIMTHNNILFGQPLVGAYSPLIIKSFYHWMHDLGDVNDSNALKVSSREQFLAASDKIDFLNVGWILSDHEFLFERYEKVIEDKDAFLYRNPHTKPRAYLEKQIASSLDLNDRQNLLNLQFATEAEDRLIVSDVFYPGWTVRVNGELALLEPYDQLFRSVKIPSAGKWVVQMQYEPLWRRWVMPCAILAGALFFLPFFLSRRRCS